MPLLVGTGEREREVCVRVESGRGGAARIRPFPPSGSPLGFAVEPPLLLASPAGTSDSSGSSSSDAPPALRALDFRGGRDATDSAHSGVLESLWALGWFVSVASATQVCRSLKNLCSVPPVTLILWFAAIAIKGCATWRIFEVENKDAVAPPRMEYGPHMLSTTPSKTGSNLCGGMAVYVV